MDTFWSKVNKECWGWNGALDSDGYGLIKLNGKVCKAHRVSWEIHCGPIPDGIDVLHSCDNRSCTNPEHLFLGTNADNIQDRCKKGRTPAGETHPRARLTKYDVVLIRAEAKHVPQTLLAKQYGVNQRTISDIVTRKRWKSVPASTDD
jgi:hypothetical protein